MKLFGRERVKRLRKLLATDRPEPTQQAARIAAMQRDLVLPSKAGVILVVLYYLFYSGWFYEVPTTRSVVQDTLKSYFLVYIIGNVLGAALFLSWRRFPPVLFQWVAFTLGLLDGLFMAGLTIVSGGFESIIFWVFPGLIVLNALSIPLAMPQIALNLLLSFFYLGAGLLSPNLARDETAMISVPRRVLTALHETNQPPVAATAFAAARSRKAFWIEDPVAEVSAEEIPTETFLLRVSVLWLLTACCYGAQLLLERQRLAAEEAGEFAARENQLQSAARLAAEFAHQIKNPLAIINNAAYSLQRSLPQSNPAAAQQVEIIQEEVARADQVVTQIMGYAQLSEGRVEKLKLPEEIDRALAQVLPDAVVTGIQVHREIAPHVPALLMQRGHLSEILVNLLLNAREALGERGNLIIAAGLRPEQTVELIIRDDGPGIAPDRIERVFEAYFTTKERGTGLGLAIVKHNVELYGGTVRAESALGKGAAFTVTLPVKALPKLFVK